MSNEITDIDQEIDNLQSQIYNHFETTYGTVGGEQTNDFQQQYKNHSKRQLKLHLKTVKYQNRPENEREIRYTSKLIRHSMQRGINLPLEN